MSNDSYGNGEGERKEMDKIKGNFTYFQLYQVLQNSTLLPLTCANDLQ